MCEKEEYQCEECGCEMSEMPQNSCYGFLCFDCLREIRRQEENE